MPHVSQGKGNHNMCGVRLDCGSAVLQEYRLKYDRAFKRWDLLKIDSVWAESGHTAPLDPLAGFKKSSPSETGSSRGVCLDRVFRITVKRSS